MSDDQIDCRIDLNSPPAAWQPISADQVMPYFKAVGLLLTLIIVWFGLCAI